MGRKGTSAGDHVQLHAGQRIADGDADRLLGDLLKKGGRDGCERDREKRKQTRDGELRARILSGKRKSKIEWDAMYVGVSVCVFASICDL